MKLDAQPHHTADVFNFLNEHFDDRVIALDYPTHTGSGVDWPSYSPDMSPCDFTLWVHLKDQMYRHNPETIEQLKRTFVLHVKPSRLRCLRCFCSCHSEITPCYSSAWWISQFRFFQIEYSNKDRNIKFHIQNQIGVYICYDFGKKKKLVEWTLNETGTEYLKDDINNFRQTWYINAFLQVFRLY